MSGRGPSRNRRRRATAPWGNLTGAQAIPKRGADARHAARQIQQELEALHGPVSVRKASPEELARLDGSRAEYEVWVGRVNGEDQRAGTDRRG